MSIRPIAGVTRTQVPLTVHELCARAGALLPGINAGAAARELERTLPHAEIRSVAEAKLITFRIPAAYGGPDSTVTEVIRFIIDLAAADSNIAQALRPSYSFIEGLRARGSEEERQRWYGRYLAGDVVGNAGWEVGGANGAISAVLTPEGDQFRVNGSKYYSTGSLYADWVSATALGPDGKPTSFTVPRDRAGLNLLDDFDAMGQRLTASGTTHLDNLLVHPEEIRQNPRQGEVRTPVTPFLQLYLGAVEAGIAKNVLGDAVAFARDHARPIVHSSATKSVDDPYVQFSVGEIAARAYAAEAVVLKAAGTIDLVWENLADTALLDEAAVQVAQAQFIAAESALKAAELIFDVGGASTTARKHNLDRHWRNARTVANHNPRHWKAAVAGAYRLTGAEPPKSGLF